MKMPVGTVSVFSLVCVLPLSVQAAGGEDANPAPMVVADNRAGQKVKPPRRAPAPRNQQDGPAAAPSQHFEDSVSTAREKGTAYTSDDAPPAGDASQIQGKQPKGVARPRRTHTPGGSSVGASNQPPSPGVPPGARQPRAASSLHLEDSVSTAREKGTAFSSGEAQPAGAASQLPVAPVHGVLTPRETATGAIRTEQLDNRHPEN